MSPPSRRSPAPGSLRVLPGGRAHAGLWREGDPVGRRQFVDVGPLDLEAGGHLPAVRVAYETWGTLAADRSNAVLVEHALTGDSHVAGPAGSGHPTAGWWDWAIGPGSADRHRPLVRRRAERAGRLPGLHRPVLRRRRTAGPGAPGSRT